MVDNNRQPTDVNNQDIYTIEPFQAIMTDKDSVKGVLFRSIPDSVVVVKRNIRGTKGILPQNIRRKPSLNYDMNKYGITFFGKRIIDLPKII